MTDFPTYQELFKPVLTFYADGRQHTYREAVEYIESHCGLTNEQIATRTASGGRVIEIRINWAHVYLKQAGLIASVKRGVNQITPAGKQVLADKPSHLDNAYLERFEGYRQFKARKGTRKKDTTEQVNVKDANESATPEEQMDNALSDHNEALGDSLLQTLRSIDAFYFEQVVADLLGTMGYGKATVTQRSNDGGVDAIVNEDALGLSKIFVQAKRYAADNRVNGKELRDFVGALDLKGVSKGIFITTSSFHGSAELDLRASQKSIILVDGGKLVELMLEHGVGVTNERKYTLKKIDNDYFYPNEESL